ncbi:Aromatic-ring hydroxylase-like protein [Cordyceps fumosorosea ARSEF 2679]|uniref:Aromatic-ring hydroxylase-like protein n=1 Tax=Cordyceps fumosorosea (strain ARSEF 2679) TaxID=1081104 RepID=A0A167LMV3_CORFA|nr:Aromatic-ring hydroxylase-like protein [Cordyceps fumosorosea ARSEF 2679]OAA53274.1 Aromatic-ring hydroxylase-like protein [Cordyceps fumosorosea ARSEF 2679]
MPQLRVLVVGASIAGTSAAYWFRRAGALVTVLECSPVFRLAGQAVDLRTVGVAVMRRIPNMEPAVRAATTTLSGIRFLDAHGRARGELRSTGDPDRQALVSEYEIFRGKLASILYSYTEHDEGVRYVFGERPAAITPTGEGPVVVEFASGRPAEEFDLVVACDGAASRTRGLAFRCEPHEHVVGTNHWAAYFDIPEDLLGGSDVGLCYNAPGGRMVCLGPDPDAGGSCKATLLSISSSSATDLTAPFRAAQEEGDAALRAFVAERFRGAGWRTDEILAHLASSPTFYASEMVRVAAPSFSALGSRVALVGDAGYAAPSGAGTSLAMAGAYVLAGEVAARPGDLRAALTAYEEVMRSLVGEVQRVSPLFWSVMAPQTAWGVALRNGVLQAVCWTGVLDAVQRLFGGAFSSAERHVLPEYEWVD